MTDEAKLVVGVDPGFKPGIVFPAAPPTVESKADEHQWQGPLVQADYYVGRRWVRPDAERWPNGVASGKRNKGMRRIIRARCMKQNSRVERNIVRARSFRLEFERLATNSHEAKRYVELALKERRTIKTWWFSFHEMWANIGESYRSLTEFARAK